MSKNTSFDFAKNIFQNALSRFSMLEGRKSVLVAFSGGADSTLLLTLLSEFDGIFVGAAHVNHGLRGVEAERDEAFCRDFCKKRSIPFYSTKADVLGSSNELGIGIEEAARNIRYDFLQSVADENHYDCIATAHNADDNVETQIFRLIRGASLDGLCGIPPTRDNIIRPLILLSKEQIICALNEKNIPFVVDSTNLSNDYSRNLIRNNVVSQLKTINPSLADTLSSSIEALKRDRDYLNDVASNYSFIDGRNALRSLHDAVLSRVIVKEASKKGISLEKKHVDLLMDAIRSEKQHVDLSLPSITAVIDRDMIEFSKEKECFSFNFPIREGINVIGHNAVIILESEKSAFTNEITELKNIYKLSIQARLNSATINTGTVIRSRRSGDTIKHNGMTKKVKKLLQTLKMPQSYTKGIPFIETDGEIVYIPHFKPSDIAAQKSESYYTVYYFAEPIKPKA